MLFYLLIGNHQNRLEDGRLCKCFKRKKTTLLWCWLIVQSRKQSSGMSNLDLVALLVVWNNASLFMQRALVCGFCPAFGD